MNEEIFFIKLHDCFNAGYQMPQFCIDNGIKKPIIIFRDENSLSFAWEIYVQFKLDKRITPKFSLLNGKSGKFFLNFPDVMGILNFEKLSSQNFKDYDKVLFFIASRIKPEISNAIYLDQLTDYFTKRVFLEIPLLHFLQHHPKVKLIVTNFPTQPKIDDKEFKEYLVDLEVMRQKLRKNTGAPIKTALDRLGYNNEEALKLMEAPPVKTNFDGSTTMEEDLDPLIVIKNNQRMTAYQPQNFQNKIYFIGTCHQYGVNAPFNKTIPSYLQKMLNENNLPYRVENESQRYTGRGQDLFYNLIKLAPKPNDIIIIYLSNLRPLSLPFCDVSNALNGYDPRDFWVVAGHANEKAYEILAKEYFKFLVANNFFQNTEFNYPAPPPPPHRYGIPQEYHSPANKLFNIEELEKHKQKLREKRLKIGCIVMNANPFHLGHEYLVEYAASRVHQLFVIVVSEDKSEFKFVDRFELVKRGTEKFPNVEVLQTEKFISSVKTFSGYFNKENLQDVYVDSTENDEMFAAEIAPSLGITIRFDGEEPRDNVTRQQNENLDVILPRYGIEHCIIPRREINGEVISAKTVRAALKVGDFEKISKLVPITTLQFLRKNYAHSTPPVAG